MGAIYDRFTEVIDRMHVLGLITWAGNEAYDSRYDDFFLTDEELWAIAYANVPALFISGDLTARRASTEHQPGVEELLEQLLDAYHAARNDG
jgi:hypothetical protein